MCKMFLTFGLFFCLFACATGQPKPADVPISSQAVQVIEQPPMVVEKPVPVPMSGQLKKMPDSTPAVKLSDPVAQSLQNARVKPPEVPEGYLNAITQYPYMEGALYQLITAPGFVSDITLKPEENLLSPPAAGDTVRWVLNVARSGDGDSARNHILIKPVYPDLTTNIVIYTDQHTYFIEALSFNGKSYMAAVSWIYPMEEKKLSIGNPINASPNTAAKAEAADLIGANIDPTRLNFAYDISGDTPKWRPVRVFDDGTKTYIEFPPALKSYEAPVLFIVSNQKELQLVNYRVKNLYYIVDRLFDTAELRLGEKKQTIVRINKKVSS